MASLTPFLALALFNVAAAGMAWRRKQEHGWKRRASLVLTVLLLADSLPRRGVNRDARVRTRAQPGHLLRREREGDQVPPLLSRSRVGAGEYRPRMVAATWASGARSSPPPRRIRPTCEAGSKAVLPPMETDSERAQRLLDSAPVKIRESWTSWGVRESVNAMPTPTIEAHSQLWRLDLCRAGRHSPGLRAQRVRVAARSGGCSRRRLMPLLSVLGVWLALLVAALTFVDRYGSNVPSWDGWDMVPTLTGHQPITAEWLWSQHNEHRVPLPGLSFWDCIESPGSTSEPRCSSMSS